MAEDTGAPDPGQDRSRKSSILIGAGTLLASGIFRQLLGLLTLAVTARLLMPEDFGIVAYFLIATALLEMFQRQFGMVLIRLEEATEDHLNTVFTIQLIFGAVAAVLFVLATPLVGLMDIPELVGLMPVTAALALVVFIRSPRFVVFERELKFSYAAVEETLSRVIYSVFAVLLAWLWRDYWSIVIATVIGQVARSGWTFIVAPMRPRLTLARWHDSLSFSSWSIGAQFAQFLAASVPQIAVGTALGIAEAGYFRLGMRLVVTATDQLMTPMLRVVYPGLADLSRKTDRGGEGFRQLNAAFLAILLPIGVGLALVAEEVIIVGFGAEWREATIVVWMLAPLMAVLSIRANIRSIAYIDGSTRTLFVRNLFTLAFVCAAMTIGVRYGFTGAVIAVAAGFVFELAVNLWIAHQLGAGPLLQPLTVAWRSFASCAVMAAFLLVLRATLMHESSAAVYLATATALGFVIYVIVHTVLWAASGRPPGIEATIAAILRRLSRR